MVSPAISHVVRLSGWNKGVMVALADHLLTVDNFQRMAEAGTRRDDDHAELIERGTVEMAPVGSVHATVVDNLGERLSEALEATFLFELQAASALAKGLSPPDGSVLKRKLWRESLQSPCPEDLLLVAEFGDSSLANARTRKPAVYASDGVPEVWLGDAPEGESTRVGRSLNAPSSSRMRRFQMSQSLKTTSLAS
jgi:Uma2 family endonuclease